MKNGKPVIILAVVILLSLISPSVYPCTTFVLHQGNKIVLGRNLDWITGSGLMMTNPRDLKKTALVDPQEKAIEWVAKYGSITFNQIGRDLPYGGINETGLVVEHMTLEQTQYPTKDDRYAISANQWIQFQLDNCSTIEEVIHSDTLLRIVDATSKYHFLISDKFGNAATIEFLDGKMVSHFQHSLPIPALANSTYESSLECYETKGDTDSNRSLYNFCTVAQKIDKKQHLSSDSIVNDAFEFLNSVNQGLGTKWSIVYDITNMRIYFKIFETPIIAGAQKIFLKQAGQAEMKFVDFRNFDFNCSENVKVFNLNENFSGAVDNQFVNYSTEINKAFITEAFTFFKDWGFDLNMSSEQIDYLAKYPETFVCKDEKNE
ncbi:MAG: linear amide C-N hydrolase [Bacteroides sp.]|jgi:choloylglycine hydrolase|nr:linear amide C-N hydrolase [Bacteroides sp.]